MPTIPKKWIPILSFLTVASFVWICEPFAKIPLPTVIWSTPRLDSEGKPGNTNENDAGAIDASLAATQAAGLAAAARVEEVREAKLRSAANVHFSAGVVKAVGEPYTKALVVPRTSDEDISWIAENFDDDAFIEPRVYTVDDMNGELHPPKNKGHEVMVYLSYIIDYYSNLSDVNIFMHSHRYAWHNDELLENDAVAMVSRLSSERVQREGFMNMRCHWDPGCPAWMHPGTVEEDINKQEETLLARSWSELFPLDPIPNVLAQPCCAQFAVSRDRIRSLPLARYVFYRDWLLRTALSDYISGRVWEYIWQFVFTGESVLCPKEHICYCDGFGICFGGEEQYEKYFDKKDERDALSDELEEYNLQSAKWLQDNPSLDLVHSPDVEAGKDMEIQGKMMAIDTWCVQKRQMAMERGDVAINRALEAGRGWQDGDGF